MGPACASARLAGEPQVVVDVRRSPGLKAVSAPGLALLLGWLIRSGSRLRRHRRHARPRAPRYTGRYESGGSEGLRAARVARGRGPQAGALGARGRGARAAGDLRGVPGALG